MTYFRKNAAFKKNGASTKVNPSRLKTVMVLTTSLPIILVGVSANAQSSGFDVSCKSAVDVRQILVVAPGEKGTACDVLYTRDRGLTVTTPYYANSDVNYCFQKAASLRDKLLAANYSCEGIGNNLRTVTKAVEPARTQAAAAVAAQSEVSVPVVASSANSADADEARDSDALRDAANEAGQNGLSTRDAFLERLRQESASAEAASQDARISELNTQENAANDEVYVPASQQNQKIANAGPVSLVASTTTQATTQPLSETKLVQARQAGNSNKLVGATPVVQASAEEQLPANTVIEGERPQEASPETPAPAAVTRKSPGFLGAVLAPATADKPRTRPDIIRATLAAQAAAWNEGDIEGFMEGYWRDSDLRFVSGTEVSKGWNSTLKRYKKRYGNGDALGQLLFENIDVQMISEDVAIVVGRFNLTRNVGQSSGIFTLVMKRFEGAWRIVHDHTVADAPAVSSAETGSQ